VHDAKLGGGRSFTRQPSLQVLKLRSPTNLGVVANQSCTRSRSQGWMLAPDVNLRSCPNVDSFWWIGQASFQWN